jgi:uncharacterized membrane protein YfcA
MVENRYLRSLRERAGRTNITGDARPSSRIVVLYCAIGLAAGLISGLLGVGGGVIVVPGLMVIAGLSSRAAAGTSLAAIGITASMGVVVFGALGWVDWSSAALVATPAVPGALVGVWLQRMLRPRVLTLGFAVFLVIAALRLFFQ